MDDTGSNFRKCLNTWGKDGVPFVFLVDYAMERPMAWTLGELDSSEVLFDLNGFHHVPQPVDLLKNRNFRFDKRPIAFEEYLPRFESVVKNIKAGNSFLVNLSVQTPVDTDLTLKEIFLLSDAPYRFLLGNKFVCFSPEIFIRINGNRIASFPMKGTIDASVPDAESHILNDPKEAAEHATIVDLIRNDLSMVCEKVWVEKYRYIDTIQVYKKNLLQVSSEVAGLLPKDFDGKYGDLLWKLLPAGSICGAPKPSTLHIIREAEGYDRGYYTGVMGYFDGENFESAVMIRFIENQGDQLVFKSGGGITAQSNARSEYQELIDKVYLPFPHVTKVMH